MALPTEITSNENYRDLLGDAKLGFPDIAAMRDELAQILAHLWLSTVTSTPRETGTVVGNVAGVVDLGGGVPGLAPGLDGRHLANLQLIANDVITAAMLKTDLANAGKVFGLDPDTGVGALLDMAGTIEPIDSWVLTDVAELAVEGYDWSPFRDVIFYVDRLTFSVDAVKLRAQVRSQGAYHTANNQYVNGYRQRTGGSGSGTDSANTSKTYWDWPSSLQFRLPGSQGLANDSGALRLTLHDVNAQRVPRGQAFVDINYTTGDTSYQCLDFCGMEVVLNGLDGIKFFPSAGLMSAEVAMYGVVKP